MSSIRQNTSSSTLSTSSTNSHSSSSSCTSNTSYSNATHPASEPIPQHLEPVHHRSSTSKSANGKDPTISATAKSSPSPSPSPHHHHNPTHSEPLIHPVKAKPKSSANHNKKAPRGCMSHFDFTYSGLYVSGSQYGRKTLGTGTGAGGSGECGIM